MVTAVMVRFICLYFAISQSLATNHGKRSPNLLILLADDVGVGDIGCYGNKTIQTPNIDRICSEGVKLNHNLATASVCTPSRAAFLTGRYPIRFGYVSHNTRERRVTVTTTASGGLPPSEITFAEAFQRYHYTTGYFGKWHLGLHCKEKDFCHSPLKNGFHYFYGLPLTNLMDCGKWSFFNLQSEIVKIPDLSRFYLSIIILCYIYLFLKNSHKPFYLFILLVLFTWYFQNVFLFFLHRQLNCVLMRNHEIVEQPFDLELLTENLVDETKHFIQKNSNNPFLAFVAFHQAHVALVPGKRFFGKSPMHGLYGDTIKELDWAIGEIIAELYKQNILNDTIIYFSSDHGPALGFVDEVTGEYLGGWKGQYRGGKGSVYEGGIRVPTMVQWSGVLPAGHTIDRPTSHLDVLPTLLSLANISSNKTNFDGEDISRLLFRQIQTGHRSFFHYCGSNLHAVTMESDKEVWKVHFVIPKYETGIKNCFGDDVIVLKKPIIYDLKKNPFEDQSIDQSDPVFKKVLLDVQKIVKEHQQTLDFSVPSQLNEEKNSFAIKRITCCNYPLCNC